MKYFKINEIRAISITFSPSMGYSTVEKPCKFRKHVSLPKMIAKSHKEVKSIALTV